MSQSIIQDFKGLSKLWPFLRPQKKKLLLAVALVPFISFFQSYIPILIKRAIDEGITANNIEALKSIGLLYLATVIMEYLTRAAKHFLQQCLFIE